MNKIDYWLKHKIKNEIMWQKVMQIHTFTKSNIRKQNSEIEIIDLGCANGIGSLPLLYWGYKVTCIDMNSQSLNRLRKEINTDPGIKKRCTLINKRMEDYETNRKFDAVILTEVIEHVANPELIIDKIYEMLKPGGILILSLPNGYGSYEICFDFPLIVMRKFFHIHEVPGHYHINFFTFGNIKSILKTRGFENVGFIKYSFLPLIPFSSAFLEKADMKIAAMLPAQLVNGWMIVSRK